MPERRVTGAWTLMLLAAAIVSSLWVGGSALGDRSLHEAPVLLVGPDVVTSALATELSARSGSPFLIETSTDLDDARDSLADGEVVAVLAIDLTGTKDQLLFPSRVVEPRDRLVLSSARTAELAYGRSFVVGRPDGRTTPAVSAPALALGAVGLGFLAALIISILHSPVAPNLRSGLRRIAVLAGVGLVAGAGSLLVGGSGWTAAVIAIAALGAGVLALASEVIGGLRALVVAALLLVVLPLPLVVLGDRWLLGQPWAFVADWSLLGAAAEAVSAPEGTIPALRVCLVLLGIPLLALLILLLWRIYVRREAGGQAVDPAELPGTRAFQRQLLGLAVGIIVFTVASCLGWVAVAHDRPEVARPSLAAATRCVPTGEVKGVADLNRIAQLRGSPEMRGGDIGASAALQGGRTIWVFGDTLRDAGVEGGGFVRNSMLLVEPGCLSVVVPESGGAIIANRDREVGYWPMSVVVSGHPGYDLVSVTAQRVRTVDPDNVFGFENVGPAIATYVVPVGGVPQLISRTDIGKDRADTTRPMWGAATAVVDGWVYLYGTARPNEVEPGTGFSMAVARAPIDRISDVSTWTYWTGNGWSRRASKATTLIPHVGGVSQTLSVFFQDGTWYALSKRNEFLGHEIVIWTAPSPTGPFTAQPPVATLPSDTATGTLRYMPLAHPELLPKPGTVIVSYSQNRTDPSLVVEDPRLYRPSLLRIKLPD